MRMIEIDYEAQPPIDGYGPNGFRVGGDWHDGPLILTAEGRQTFDAPITFETLLPILQATERVDLVVIGQGPEIAQIPADLRHALDSAGIGVEIMATQSACRTYNVLLTEDRRVAAVLLPVGAG